MFCQLRGAKSQDSVHRPQPAFEEKGKQTRNRTDVRLLAKLEPYYRQAKQAHDTYGLNSEGLSLPEPVVLEIIVGKKTVASSTA